MTEGNECSQIKLHLSGYGFSGYSIRLLNNRNNNNKSKHSAEATCHLLWSASLPEFPPCPENPAAAHTDSFFTAVAVGRDKRSNTLKHRWTETQLGVKFAAVVAMWQLADILMLFHFGWMLCCYCKVAQSDPSKQNAQCPDIWNLKEAEANSSHSGISHSSLSSFLCAERGSQKARLRLQHSAAGKAFKTEHSAKLITDPKLIVRL